MTRLALALALGFGALSPVNAAAADTGARATTENEFFDELPVVLSVSRLAQPIDEAPAAVTVIDRDMIRASGARSVADLLRYVPGFTTAMATNVGPAVIYHGLSEAAPPRVQVLVDGRSQYSSYYFGGVLWNLMPVALEDIERIEVVRGSNSAVYGANAFLGVINILTRRGEDVPKVTVGGNQGQGGIRDRYARVAGASGGFSGRLSYAETFDEGDDLLRDSVNKRLFDARADLRLSPVDEVSIRFGGTTVGLQVGAQSLTNPSREEEKGQNFLLLEWQRALGENSDLAVRYFHVNEWLHDSYLINTRGTELEAKYGRQIVLASSNTRAARHDFEVQHTVRARDDLRFVWGLNVRRDTIRSPAFFGGEDEVDAGLDRIFGVLEWRPAAPWLINLAATHERDQRHKSLTSPRLMANYRVNESATVRAGVSRAYRSPALFETHGDRIFASETGVVFERQRLGNPELRPESILAREIGFHGRYQPWGMTVDVRAFHEKVSDLVASMIVATRPPFCEQERIQMSLGMVPPNYCGTADVPQNMADARIRGIEYEVEWRPVDGTRLRFNQSFAKTTASLLVSPQTYPGLHPLAQFFLADGQRMTLATNLAGTTQSGPTHSLSLLWLQRLWAGFEMSVGYQAVGGMKWTDDTSVQSYRRLDWRLAYRFRTGPAAGELAFNVTGDGRPRAEYDSRNVQGTRAFTSLRLEF